MELNRRDALSLLRSAALAAASSSLLAACATSAKAGSIRAAGLLPLSGRAAELGQSMARAVQLAEPGRIADGSFFIADTLGTPEGAAAAAAAAVKFGAQLIFGPLFSAELPPVLQVVGTRIPVVAFTNDPGMVGSGAFILGVTPSQTVTATLKYAGSQGVRRVAIVGKDTPWTQGVVAAARKAAGEARIEIAGVTLRGAGDENASLIGAVKSDSGGALPDAVLLPDGNVAVTDFAPVLGKAGIKLLGTVQWSGLNLSEVPAMNGAWFAAPDPAGFAPFADAYARMHGAQPGLLAGLAYDAARMTGAVGATGNAARDTLVASVGFPGVTGNFKLNGDGSCLRQLAILAVEPGGTRVVAPISAV